jgi:hypothetical protein
VCRRNACSRSSERRENRSRSALAEADCNEACSRAQPTVGNRRSAPAAGSERQTDGSVMDTRLAAASDEAELFEIHRAVFRGHIEQIWGWDEEWQRANFAREMAS